ARQYTVAAGDTAWLACRLHYAVAGSLDRVRRAHLGAGRLLAVHADDRNGLDTVRPVDELEMDHRIAPMGVALGARLHARLAADAAVGIDEEVEVLRFRHRGPTVAARAARRMAAGRRL